MSDYNEEDQKNIIDDDEDEEIELNPPDHEAVAGRALCLAALVMRGEFERVIQNAPNVSKNKPVATNVISIHEDLIQELEEWVAFQGLDRHMSAGEKLFFSVPPGQWQEQHLINASWRSESLAVILWALNLENEILPYDTMVGQKKIVSKAGMMKPFADLLVRSRLRSQEELFFQRDVAETMHWRARTAQLKMNGFQWEQELSVEVVVKMAAETALSCGEISEIRDEDFVLFNKPYKNLTEDEFFQAMSIVMERHFALNWLCGYSENWDETPMDT